MSNVHISIPDGLMGNIVRLANDKADLKVSSALLASTIIS
ncbi:hypothetical protein wTpre_376 [Wolbachia endosymbiont of Trichogramma pretiosum]|nr:hypothetical protein wTpre_376 [Wolbachia endosymbiont of Trichogramma pretiosum]